MSHPEIHARGTVTSAATLWVLVYGRILLTMPALITTPTPINLEAPNPISPPPPTLSPDDPAPAFNLAFDPYTHRFLRVRSCLLPPRSAAI